MISLEKLDTMPEAKLRTLHKLLLAADRIKCEQSYFHFFEKAWKVLEPDTPLVANWHIEYLCDIVQKEVERITAGKPKKKDIIINMPPRSGKSYIVTVMLTPWIWTRYPWMKVINSSFSMELSTKLCLDSRRLIESGWYKLLWGHKFSLTSDQNTKSWYENDKRGMRKSTSTGAMVTGTGADIIIVDDAQSPEGSESDVERETAKRHYGKTLYSRLNNQKTGIRIIVQQRLHEDDLTGYLLKNDVTHYQFICLPAELTDSVEPKSLMSKYQNGLFFPERFSRSVLDQAKLPANLGSYGYSGQMLQRPSPPEGGLFKRAWWRFWKRPGQEAGQLFFKDESNINIQAVVVDLPDRFDQIVDSWDTALEGKETSDDVVGSKWGRLGSAKFLMDEIKGKLDFPATKKAVKSMYQSNRDTSAVLIEKSSNGPAVKADLEKELPSIILVSTGKLSKEDRVKLSNTVPYTAQAEAGNIYLPHPEIAPWVMDFIEEHATFPKCAQDGQVDSASQAVNYLTTTRKVWEYYQPMNPQHHQTFPLKWQYVVNIGAVYLSKDMEISFICAIWSRLEHKLYIYGEMVTDQMGIHAVARSMFAGMKMDVHKVFGIIGNKEMFEADKKSISALMNEELRLVHKEKKARISAVVRGPIMYDRLGSIGLVNLMFHKNEIVVHESLGETSRQLASWPIEGGKPAEGYAICEALCHIVSELNRTEKLTIPVQQPRDYRPVEKKKKKLQLEGFY